MPVNYQLLPDIDGLGPARTIKKIEEDGTERYVPLSDGNRDYVEYQAWRSEGNVPLAADQ